MSLVKDYLSKTKYYKDIYGEKTIVLMQVGAFYEIYGLKNNNIISGSNIEDFKSICVMNT